MMPPRNARLLTWISGISALPENGISEWWPLARKAMPSTTTRAAGTIDPAIVPTVPMAAERLTPGRLARVMPQKNVSMTTMRKTLFVARSRSITYANEAAMNDNAVGYHTMFWAYSAHTARNPVRP